jgi:hypothetical protein
MRRNLQYFSYSSLVYVNSYHSGSLSRNLASLTSQEPRSPCCPTSRPVGHVAGFYPFIFINKRRVITNAGMTQSRFHIKGDSSLSALMHCKFVI